MRLLNSRHPITGLLHTTNDVVKASCASEALTHVQVDGLSPTSAAATAMSTSCWLVGPFIARSWLSRETLPSTHPQTRHLLNSSNKAPVALHLRLLQLGVYLQVAYTGPH